MSQTEIGRIGSSHILTSPQDDASYLFNSAMWCTHPLLGDAFLDSGSLSITAASTLVTGTATLFTSLCNNFDNSNIPANRYIAYEDGGGKYGILEVDYVIDDLTLILKTPAFQSATVTIASQINQFGTPLLNEVEIRSVIGSSITFTLANKYATRDITLLDYPYDVKNEGGVEPQLVLSIDTLVTLKY